MSNVHIHVSAIHSALCARLALASAGVAAAIMLYAPCAVAQNTAPGSRDLPARTIPVPDTVSPQMQKLIAAPPPPTWDVIPKTVEEWKAQVNAGAAAVVQTLPALREKLGVKVEPLTIDGVKAYMVTPENIPAENRNRLLIQCMAVAT
jgi:epsilon-lactone hydrolase